MVPVSGHHPVSGHLVVGHAEIGTPVFHEHVPFLERPFVEQNLDTFARRKLAFGMLRLDPALSTAQPGASAHVFKALNDVMHHCLPSVQPLSRQSWPEQRRCQHKATNVAADRMSRMRPARRANASASSPHRSS